MFLTRIIPIWVGWPRSGVQPWVLRCIFLWSLLRQSLDDWLAWRGGGP